MSIEKGIVDRIDTDWAWIKARRTSACAGCSSKDHCHSLGSGHMLIKARNTARAKAGDEVEVFLNTRTKLKCLFLLYVVPVLGLMTGAFAAGPLSRILGLNKVAGMVLFISAGVAISYYLVRIYSDRLVARGLLSPVVRKIRRRAVPSV